MMDQLGDLAKCSLFLRYQLYDSTFPDLICPVRASVSYCRKTWLLANGLESLRKQGLERYEGWRPSVVSCHSYCTRLVACVIECMFGFRIFASLGGSVERVPDAGLTQTSHLTLADCQASVDIHIIQPRNTIS